MSSASPSAVKNPAEEPATADEYREWLASVAKLPRSERVEKLFAFQPTEYQADLLDYHEEHPKAQAAPKSGRQVGKTLTAAVIGADHAIMHPGTDVLFAAPSQGTADEMFRECKQHFKNSPFSLSRFGVETPNKQTWEFTTSTRILSRTFGNVDQKDNSGNRGMNPTCVIGDEAAYEKDAVYTEEIEEFFITHPSYEYYLFSTPAGKTGYFYDAVEGENTDDWFSPHWPTRISPYAQEDYIEKKRDQLDSQTFAQEFLGEFAESEDAYLPHSIVKPCIQPDVIESADEHARRWLAVDPARSGADRAVYLDLDEHGAIRNIWSEETTTGPEFVGRLKALQRGGDVPPPDVGSGVTPDDGYEEIVVEENAVGGFGADLVEEGLGRVVRKITTSTKTKQAMYQRLKKDLEDGALSLPNYRRLITQLTALQYKYTSNGYLKISHRQGGHDDFPDALALGNHARSNAPPPRDNNDSSGGVGFL